MTRVAGEYGYVPVANARPPEGRSRRRRFRFFRMLLILVLVLFLVLVGAWFYLDHALHRTTALGDYPGRPAQGDGTNWLVVGTNAPANPDGPMDTMLLVHLPDNTVPPTLVSLPRDSALPIPGHGMGALGSVYRLGGAPLLARTVEQATGLRIDHYAQVAYTGFPALVNAAGGVSLCVPSARDDPLAGLNVPAGCQTVRGQQALGYVRTTAGGDSARTARQRQFTGALADRLTRPAVYLNPVRLAPLLVGLTRTVTVNHDDHFDDLAQLTFGLRHGPVSTSVPTVDGSTWDANRAAVLFNALRIDQLVPSIATGGDPVPVSASGS